MSIKLLLFMSIKLQSVMTIKLLPVVGISLVPVLGVSLALTLVLEFAFSLLCKIKNNRDLLLILLVNIVTNPAVVLIYHLFPSAWIKLPLELAAIGVEAFYYTKYASTIKHPILFSIGANCFSFVMGYLLNQIILKGFA